MKKGTVHEGWVEILKVNAVLSCETAIIIAIHIKHSCTIVELMGVAVRVEFILWNA